MMNESRPEPTEITVFINTVLLSVDRHKQLLGQMIQDVEARQEEMQMIDYLDIGWKLGTIDSYFSNLNSVLGLCAAIVDEPVPVFISPGAASPTGRIQGLIDYLEEVEEMLNRLVATRITSLEQTGTLTDQEINSWLAGDQ